MNKYFCTLILLVLSFSTYLQAQEIQIKTIETFFDRYKSDGIGLAIDSLYGTNKWLGHSSDQIIQLKTKMQLELGNEDNIGKMHGYEPIVSKALKGTLTLYTYLVKYERQPIRFTFIFYKPKDKWLFYSFKYDGYIPEELEESAKIYYEVNQY